MPLATAELPKIRNLRAVRNDSFRRTVTVSESGTGIDLTGYSITGTIRRRVDGPVIAVFGIENRVDASGQFQIVLTTAQTADLQGDYCYDIQVALIGSESTNTHTVSAGSFVVAADKTTP